jgi:hypothetical protein
MEKKIKYAILILLSVFIGLFILLYFTNNKDNTDIDKDNTDIDKDIDKDNTDKDIDNLCKNDKDKKKLPVVIITTKGVDPSTRDKNKAYFDVTSNNIKSTDLKQIPISIAIRGQSSRLFPKKQWKIKFDNKISILGMSKSKKYILQGPYLDKSLIRTKLMYDLSRKLNMYASKTLLVELFLNTTENDELNLHRDYWGVYLLMEKIEIDTDKVNIGQCDYLFQFDKISTGDLTFTIPKLNDKDPSDNGIQVVLKEPEEIDKLKGLKKLILDFEHMLYTDRMWNEYENYIDVKSFVDGFLLNELSHNEDSYKWSTYLYTKNGKIYVGPLWDYNMAFMQNPKSSIDGWQLNDTLNDERTEYQSNGENKNKIYKGLALWYYRLFQIENFKQSVTDRFFSLRYSESIFNNEYLKNMMYEEYVQYLTSDYNICYDNQSYSYETTSPVIRNFKKWDVLQLENINLLNWIVPFIKPVPNCYSGVPNWILCTNNENMNIENISAIGRVYNFCTKRLDWMEQNIINDIIQI